MRMLRKNPKFRLAALLACLVVALSGLVAFGYAPYTNHVRGLVTPSSTIQPETENIPVYPGAQVTQPLHDLLANPARSDAAYARQFSLRAPDEIEDVMRFYKEALPKYGWTGMYPIYVWTDPKGISSFHLDLEVNTDRSQGVIGPGAIADMIVSRWPDLAKMPLYQGAHQLKVTSTKETENSWPITTTIESYLTDARPAELETFYDSMLLPLGWYFFGPDGVTDRQRGSIPESGLTFGAHHRGSSMDTGVGMRLWITAHVESSGQMRVQLKVREAEGPYPRY